MRVAIVGATGQVGVVLRSILAERAFPVDEMRYLASSRSAGTTLPWGDQEITVEDAFTTDPSGIDLALCSAPASVSRTLAPRLAEAGAIVIDNSSAWRMDPDVPLVVPEANAEAAKSFSRKYIIANPNCSTAQLVVALKPLHDRAKILRVVVSTYQSVSGAGKDAMDELFSQTRAVFVSDPVETKKFPKRIAFNVIPEIDVFMEDGFTKEEWKMVAET